MSYVEAQTWRAYRESSGPFNLGTRIEHGFALLATCIINTNGGKTTVSDFIPERAGRKPEAKVATLEDAFNMLKSLGK